MLNMTSASQIEHINQAMDTSADFCCSANLGWSVFSILGTINFNVGDGMAPRQEGGQKILILML